MTEERLKEIEVLTRDRSNCSASFAVDVRELIAEIRASQKKQNESAEDYVRIYKENQSLRDLLREARELVSNFEYKTLNGSASSDSRVVSLVARIDAALGEKQNG